MTGQSDTVTLTVRKSHLMLALGLVIGIPLGFLIRGWSASPPSDVVVSAQDQTRAPTSIGTQTP